MDNDRNVPDAGGLPGSSETPSGWGSDAEPRSNITGQGEPNVSEASAGISGTVAEHRDVPSGPATSNAPLSGGRVDAAAATLGSSGAVTGGAAMGDPNVNVGGAMGSEPGSAVADAPPRREESGPSERSGVLGGTAAARGVTTGGGTIAEAGAEAGDTAAEAAGRGAARQG